ncbi:folic acid synthesis protein-like protein [Venturia nashicola]|nr:folic acid synthesis protein-like protein [Venturia nashicola]
MRASLVKPIGRIYWNLQVRTFTESATLYRLGKRLSEAFKERTSCDNSSEAGCRETTDFVATNFAHLQQEFVSHKTRIEQAPRYPAPNSIAAIEYGRPNMDFARLEVLKAEGKSRFFVALGSNVGDRLNMIERACLEMEEEGIQIVRTSGLWETKAMYVEDQANFLNGVCEIVSTDKDPKALLIKLKSIEDRLGRVKVIEKGPRSIDLDVLLWNHDSYEDESTELPISVPHKLMREREFVLRPLCELVPKEILPSPYAPYTFKNHLENLLAKGTLFADEPSARKGSMSTQVQLSPSLPPLSPLDPYRKTEIMSILNVTPDSFSDGGVNDTTDMTSLKATITAHLENGAKIIDIGGQTSKPGAVSITAEEETSRILPAIKVIKEIAAANKHYSPAISIDTYRASVAKTAIEAGAHIVNDISASLLDADMLPTIAKLGCTYIMMHMRGTPSTMTNPENTTYNGDLIQIIGSELLARVQAAEAAGIRRWRMILDPGIGFAKTKEQNLELLRRFGELRDFDGLQGIPWLVGTSRKGFIGKITGVEEAGERVMGTAVTVVAAIQGGADIIRVHDVKEMVEVQKMADALYRGSIEKV